jgi:hypothetical protein
MKESAARSVFCYARQRMECSSCKRDYVPIVYTPFKILCGRPRLVAGLAAFVLGSAALAAVVAWAPASAERPIEIFAPEHTRAARARCEECGVITSKREIGEPSDGKSLQSALNSSRRYEITVRLADGSRRVIDDLSPANWRTGERVTLIDGVNRPSVE